MVENREIYTQPVFNAPVGMSQRWLVLGKLEWLVYHMLTKVLVKPIQYNTGTWQIGTRTESLYPYRAITRSSAVAERPRDAS